jgi:WS/DGAT/MGAT family acyltransferase
MVKKNLSKNILSPVDNAWFRMELPTNLMMITGVFFIDQPIELAAIKEIMGSRLLRFQRFRQRIKQPRFSWLPAYWEDDSHFDINSHVHRIALPAPGNQSALQELINDFMATPLDFSKPLWQIHLVENYGDGCALLCRLHHCIGDGVALMRVLFSLTDDVANPDEQQTNKTDRSRSRTTNNGQKVRPFSSVLARTSKNGNLLVKRGLERLADPGQLLAGLKFGAESSAALANLLLLSPDPETPYKGELGVAKRCAWTRPLLLSDVKEVGRVCGGTVNDVLLTAVAGALGKYLRSRGEPIGGLNFRAVVPVNLRPADEELKLGNSFGLIFLSLPVGIEDPLDRLYELKKRMDAIKGTPEAIVAYGILNAIGIASREIEDIVVGLFGQKATTVMTNVPGPKEVRFFAGRPIKGLMFWVPQSGRLGLGVSILSYAGTVLIGVATDAALTPDPESIVALIHGEFEELMDLVRMAKESDAEMAGEEPDQELCEAITLSGNRCKNKARENSRYCYKHQKYVVLDASIAP